MGGDRVAMIRARGQGIQLMMADAAQLQVRQKGSPGLPPLPPAPAPDAGDAPVLRAEPGPLPAEAAAACGAARLSLVPCDQRRGGVRARRETCAGQSSVGRTHEAVG
jgi:hypothetical protein